jgi:hypothetical protein
MFILFWASTCVSFGTNGTRQSTSIIKIKLTNNWKGM